MTLTVRIMAAMLMAALAVGCSGGSGVDVECIRTAGGWAAYDGATFLGDRDTREECRGILDGTDLGETAYSDVVGQEDSTIAESYALLQIHRDWAREMGDVIAQLWSWCGQSGRIDTSEWAEHKRITVYSVSNDHAYGTVFEFSNLRYDPDATQILYGEPKVLAPVDATVPGSRYIYDLSDSTDDGHFSQKEEITLQQDRSVTVTHGMTFDASLSSETTVGGDIAGIGLEQKLTATFGYSNTEETQKAEAESKAVTEEHTFDVPLPAGRITYISISTSDISSSRPLSIRGVADADVEIHLGQPCTLSQDWWDHAGSWVIDPDNAPIWDCWGGNPHGARYPSGQGPKGIYNWWNWVGSHDCPIMTTMGGIESIFNGTDASWQGFRRGDTTWLDQAPATAKTAIDTATGAHLRSVDLSGIQHREYQQGAETSVRAITDADISDLVRQGAKTCDITSPSC